MHPTKLFKKSLTKSQREHDQREHYMDITKPPQDTYERKVWLVAMLRLKKSSYAALAREQGVSRNAVRKAVERRAPRMERVIAAKIGYAPELVWP